MTEQYKKILIVEDGEIDSQILSQTLKWRGYEPILAKSFADAVRMVDENSIGGIITDCNHPYHANGNVVIYAAVDFLSHLMLKRKDNYAVVVTSNDRAYGDFAEQLGIPFVHKDEGADKMVDKLEELLGVGKSFASSMC